MATRDKFLPLYEKKKEKNKNPKQSKKTQKGIISAILCHMWKNGNLSGKPQVKPSAANQVSFSLLVRQGCHVTTGKNPRIFYTPIEPILSCISSAQDGNQG